MERIAGETKWSFWGLLVYAIEGIVAFSTAPLVVSTIIGVISCGLSFFGAGFIALRKVIFDYVYFLTVTAAVFVSFFVSGYFFLFWNLMRVKGQLSARQAFAGLLTLIFMHFVFFRQSRADCVFLLYAINVTCYFHYIIPILLNSMLVMYFILHENFEGEEKFSPLRAGMIFLAVYFGIFSNVLNNIVFASYVSWMLLKRYINGIGLDGSRIRSYIERDIKIKIHPAANLDKKLQY